ncbi:MAG: IclR family transcriptional regulator [Deltaproteobacteria bacterium]|nr:IclR family transcriptional regulator [Deltaproteobacteria bacterium]
MPGDKAMAGAATVEKALDVLFYLHDVGGALRLSEIGRALDLPKSSCHRLLSSLVDREVVDRDEVGRYRPGLALLSLGIGAQRREPVVSAARHALEAEADRFAETVFLVGLRHGRLRVLDKVEGPGFLRAAPGIGDVVPSDVTAAGKLYAVFGASLEQDSLPAAEASDIARQGYALNRDAWIEGLSVLGVPIWQSSGHGRRDLVAVLALAAASPHFERLGETEVAESLLGAAVRVTGRLAGTGSARRGAPETGR